MSLIRSGRISGHFRFLFVSDRVGTGLVCGHLVSDHFEFRIISSWIGLGIESSNVRSFQVLNRTYLDQVRRVYRLGSNLFSNDINYDIYIFTHILPLIMLVTTISYFFKTSSHLIAKLYFNV
jgi:hypothetical protein